MLETLERPKEAIVHLEARVVLLEGLAAPFAENPEYRSDLFYTYAEIGGLLENEGELAAAADAYRKALVLGESLLAEAAANQDLTKGRRNYPQGSGADNVLSLCPCGLCRRRIVVLRPSSQEVGQ